MRNTRKLNQVLSGRETQVRKDVYSTHVKPLSCINLDNLPEAPTVIEEEESEIGLMFRELSEEGSGEEFDIQNGFRYNKTKVKIGSRNGFVNQENPFDC